MKKLMIIVLLLTVLAILPSGCAGGMAYRIDVQHTDHPTLPFRAQEIGTRDGWEGQIERTLCRKAQKPTDMTDAGVCK